LAQVGRMVAAAALSNILSLAILWSFTRAEGLPLDGCSGGMAAA
jgi:hypothetical protein